MSAPYICSIYRQPGMYFTRTNPYERYRGRSYLFSMDPFYSSLNWQTKQCPPINPNNPLGEIKPLDEYRPTDLIRKASRALSSGSY
jgi:hypothetical protein